MVDYQILLIEPFYSGSHKQFMDLIYEFLLHELRETAQIDLYTLPGKKWHWRARTSALYFSQNVPIKNYNILFTSSVLPLQELLGLRPDLSIAKKIIYFHENQLVYPVRKNQDRDFQYGYNQILSCLVADTVVFNSRFNQDSFLGNIDKFFKLQPDFRPTNLRALIEPKCLVAYFPIDFEKIPRIPSCMKDGPMRIVWPHRWEFDKNPELFFRILFRMKENDVPFRVSVLGQEFTDNPSVFTNALKELGDHIDHFGKLEKKLDFFQVLHSSDVVLSTADHEFFGVSLIEACFHGCYPICPNKLVYPEILKHKDFLYKDEEHLYEKLKAISSDISNWRNNKEWIHKLDVSFCDWKVLQPFYRTKIFEIDSKIQN